jgi:exonuclease III
VCTFVKTHQHFSKIDIFHNCNEQDFESCAIQLVTKTSHLIILSLYSAPSGEISEFLRRLDSTLKHLYNPKSEFIIFGDININYLNESSQEKK